MLLDKAMPPEKSANLAYRGWTRNPLRHHWKTMGNHCLLVFTGDSSFQGFLGGAISGFRPPTEGLTVHVSGAQPTATRPAVPALTLGAPPSGSFRAYQKDVFPNTLCHTVDGQNPEPPEKHGKPLFVGMCREFSFLGFLGGAGIRPSTDGNGKVIHRQSPWLFLMARFPHMGLHLG